jgi:hypothetical protein
MFWPVVYLIIINLRSLKYLIELLEIIILLILKIINREVKIKKYKKNN